VASLLDAKAHALIEVPVELCIDAKLRLTLKCAGLSVERKLAVFSALWEAFTIIRFCVEEFG